MQDAFRGLYGKTLNFASFARAVERVDRWYRSTGVLGQVRGGRGRAVCGQGCGVVCEACWARCAAVGWGWAVCGQGCGVLGLGWAGLG